MSTQWNIAGLGSIVGLNYVALSFVFETIEVKDKRDCFDRLRVMEAEALKIIRVRQKNGSTA